MASERMTRRVSIGGWLRSREVRPSVQTPTAVSPLPPVWHCPYCWTGSTIYFATGNTVEGVNLFRVHIEKKNWKVSGPAERITSGAGMQFGASVGGDGRLVYSNLVWITSIWTLEAKPDQGIVGGQPVQVAEDVMAKFSPSLSRDGSKLAYSAFAGAGRSRGPNSD